MSDKLYNNAGQISSPTPESSSPKVSQTAQQLKCDNGADGSVTVTAGQRYRVTSMIKGGFVLGLLTVATGSEANIRWCCPIYRSIEITIPSNYTTLYYTSNTDNDAVGYLVELD